MTARAGRPGSRLHVGVVYGPELEPVVLLGRSHQQLLRRLGRYIRRNAPILLWPEDAGRVVERLDLGDLEGAVEAYFRALRGDCRDLRWEQQQLVVRQVRCPRDGARRP